MDKENPATLEKPAVTPSAQFPILENEDFSDPGLKGNTVFWGQTHGKHESKNNIRESEKYKPTEDLASAINQAQFLIAYVAREGNVLDSDSLNTLIRSRQLFESGSFSTKDEVAFWLAYNELVRKLRPVSIESLEASLPPPVSNRRFLSPGHTLSAASGMVRRYRLLSAFSLVFLLITQIYWLVGSEVSGKLEQTFAQRERAGAELTEYRYERNLKVSDETSTALEPITPEQDPALARLKKHYNFLNQLLDTNYELLQRWNKIWGAMLFMESFQGKSTEYNTLKFEIEQRRLQEKLNRLEQRALENNKAKDTAGGNDNSPDNAGDNIGNDASDYLKNHDTIVSQLEQGHLGFAYDKARNRFLLNRISADFALSALQVYLLPLLYGLLGAATYILRQLSIATREMTFTRNAGIHFRLRISLGALAGMTIGWFLSPDDASALSLSPFALAFLVGYNVELLFLLMDKFIQSMTNTIGSESKEDKPTKPPLENRINTAPPEPVPTTDKSGPILMSKKNHEEIQ
ncbi:MAG: hypothetical protein KJO08_09130 [Gammaproteobacteria bacterium]|nr:hypothetical protein [Gammaproteobacteria bacterium]NNJ83917.1 hypothetical protein [Gammaproteobacteria bacterium]